MKVRVSDIEPGMKVDLADDPYAVCADPICLLHAPGVGVYNYEYAVVSTPPEQETPDCVLVNFEGDSIGFPPDHYLEVEGQR